MTCIMLAAAMFSAEACTGGIQKIQTCSSKMQSALGSGSVTCALLDDYFACVESGLSVCDARFKSTMLKQLKDKVPSMYKSLGDCKVGSGKGDSAPKPSPKPSPAPAPSPVPASCASLNLQSKMTDCMKPLMQGASSGNACGAWSSFECCLVDSVASCGESMQSKVKSMLASTRKTFKSQPAFTALDGCAAATCASGSSPAPAEAAMSLMATIILENPRTFDLEKYIAAAKKRTGASAVQAVLKSFEILVKYALPASETVPLSKIKAAIAKANGVQESSITLETSGSRRLGAQRLLAASGMSLDVTISVPDADTAVAVKESAADTKSLESELGVKVSLSKDPEAIAKVATVLTSDPSMSSTLKSKLEEVGGDIGGTVAVAVMPSTKSSENSASSTFGSLLAPVMALVAVVLAAM